MFNNPAAKIQTPRLLLRMYRPEDAKLLKTAVDNSLEHLLPWMPFAKNEPEPLEHKQSLLKNWMGNFLLDKDYCYGVFDKDGTELLASTGLHTRRGKGILEIGYWVSAAHTGKGCATELAYALTKVGLQIAGAEKIEIRCDAANVRSARIPQKLGYKHEGNIRQLEKDGSGRRVEHMLWTMFAEEFAPMPQYGPVSAFDLFGNEITGGVTPPPRS